MHQLFGRGSFLRYKITYFQTPLSRSSSENGNWKKLGARLFSQNRWERRRRRQAIEERSPNAFVPRVLIHEDRQHAAALQKIRALGKPMLALDQFQSGTSPDTANMCIDKTV